MRMSIRCTLLCTVLAAPMVMAMAATTQDGPLPAIEKKFKLTQMTLDRSQVADPGTPMEIVANGINALPWGGLVTFDNPIVDGKVKQRSSGISLLRSAMNGMKNTHILQPGDRVYITKMELGNDAKNDVLRLVILTCDPLDVDGGESQRRYSAGLSFQFPKNTLAESSPDELEQDIEAVLKPSTGDSGGDQQQQAPQQQAAAPIPAPAPAPAPPPPAPVQTATISMGETTEQVIGAMGLPKQVIDLGAKKIYQYPSMKITFYNDKVKDVE